MAVRIRGKRYKEAAKLVPPAPIALDKALPVLKTFKRAKFDESVNLVIHLGIDPKQADQMVRGAVSLPKGIGKTKRVIAFVQGGNIDAAKAAGAVEAGADELIAKVNGGWTEFDIAVASPDMMPKIARLGKVLGPQGKMPSPKAGTVTTDVATAVKEYTAGKKSNSATTPAETSTPSSAKSPSPTAISPPTPVSSSKPSANSSPPPPRAPTSKKSPSTPRCPPASKLTSPTSTIAKRKNKLGT